MRRILLITGKDVHNKGPFVIYKELIKRGFKVDVYATTLEDGHTLLFDHMGVKIQSVDALDENVVEQYDYIFSAVPIFHIKLFRFIHKYIFLNPSAYWDEVYFSGDFIFTARDISKSLGEDPFPAEKINYIKSLPAMATGGAVLTKNKERIDCCSPVKKILFVDAGHFPFGSKRELAEYIVQIAQYCSECEVKLKPRYLPEDVDTSHKNKENVLCYLEEYANLPNNLVIIREHTDFQEELKDCDLVICSEGTTSYVEAILAKRRLIIFTGFPSEESALWTNCRRRRFLKINSQLKNRVYYKDIFKYLPEGIETTGNELDDFLYETDNAVENIVDAMEYIYENGIKRGMFPSRKYFTSSTYKNLDFFNSSQTWQSVIEKRYKTIAYDRVSSKMFRLCSVLNCDKIIDYIESEECNEENISDVCDMVESILYDLIIDSSDRLMDDAYSQSFLCLAYYKKGRFNEFNPYHLKCTAYYNYCMAKKEYDKKNYWESLKYLDEYFNEIGNNLYYVTYADDPGVVVMAHFFKGANLYYVGKYEEASKHLTICDLAWEGNHKKAKVFLNNIKAKGICIDDIKE